MSTRRATPLFLPASIGSIAILLASCTGSVGQQAKPADSSQSASVSKSKPNSPLKFAAVSSRQNKAIQKIVPQMPGVQNVAYDPSGHEVSVYLIKQATARQTAIVRAEVTKLKQMVKAPK